jgi:hypothetical protein
MFWAGHGLCWPLLCWFGRRLGWQFAELRSHGLGSGDRCLGVAGHELVSPLDGLHMGWVGYGLGWKWAGLAMSRSANDLGWPWAQPAMGWAGHWLVWPCAGLVMACPALGWA